MLLLLLSINFPAFLKILFTLQCCNAATIKSNKCNSMSISSDNIGGDGFDITIAWYHVSTSVTSTAATRHILRRKLR
jgi:hypothetical protein